MRTSACLLLGLLVWNTLEAQINVSGNLPDTIFVDGSCTGILDWVEPTFTCEPDPPCTVINTSFSISPAAYTRGGAVPAGETVVVAYTIRTNLGGTYFFGFDVEFVDTIPPVFASAPADATYDCLTDVPSAPTLTATDNCSATTTVTYLGQSTPPSSCASGSFTRTWEAEDATGNTAVHVQNITINADPTPPVFTMLPVDVTVACGATPTFADWLADQQATVTATDTGCGSVLITDDGGAVSSTVTSSCDSYTVTFTATDACGNTATAQADYTIEDNIAPVITPPVSTNLTLECDGVPSDPITQILTFQTNLTASDNCTLPADLIWTNDYTGLTGGCGGSTGTTAVTYTVDDGCGNTASILINFTVDDNNPPNITVGAQDITVECVDWQNDLTTWLGNRASSMASDVCTDNADIALGYALSATGSAITQTDVENNLSGQLAAGCGASVTVFFFFEDACGNRSTSDADFEVVDNIAPQWATAPSNLTVECDGTNDPGNAIATWLASNGGGVPFDECRIALVNNTYVAPVNALCGAAGSEEVTFIVADACGNIATATALVTIEDTTAPIITTTASNMTVECDGAGNTTQLNNWLVSNGGAVATDVCGSVSWSNNYTPVAPTCGAASTVMVTFTATDACGNQSQTTASFTIEDTTAPSINTNPSSLTVECDAMGNTVDLNNWLATNGGATASDICGGVTWSNNFTTLVGGCGNSGNAVVTFTATDACGNIATATAAFTIEDTTAPSVSSTASNLTVQCNGSGNVTDLTNWLASNGGATAADDCGTVVWTNDFTTLSNICGNTGSAVVNFTATDACGNSTATAATFTIEDTQAPTIIANAISTTEECEMPVQAFADWLNTHGGAVAVDNCGPIDNTAGSSNWTTNVLSIVPACGLANVTTVQFIVEDACGNTASTTASYTTEDNISPEINPTSTDEIVPCEGIAITQPQLTTWIDNRGGAAANDGCGASVWTTFDYVDGAGNTGINISFGDYTNYPVVAAGDCDWTVQVTFRAQDDCNNTSTSISNWAVEDMSAPAFVMGTVPASLTMVPCEAIPAAITPSVTDDCDLSVDVVMVETTAAGACANEFVLTRTWTATDDCLNSVVVAQTISVIDDTAPMIISSPASATVSCDNIPAVGMPTVSDNCDGAPQIVLTETSTQTAIGACSDFNYSITRTWMITDACGNTASTQQVITVEDNTPPTYSAPADLTIDCSSSFAPAVTGQPTAIVDNCDGAPTVSFADASAVGTCANESTIIRTWTIVDACGNMATTFAQSITIMDMNAPMLVAAASNQVYSCDNGDGTTEFNNWISNHGGATATDNCSGSTDLIWFAATPGSYDPNTFNPASPGSFSYTAAGLSAVSCPSATPGVFQASTTDFIVFDECGNFSVTSATFELEDNIPPVFVNCPSPANLTNIAGQCEAIYTMPIPIIEDGCGNIPTSYNYGNVGGAMTVTSSVGGDEDVPVNALTLSFNVPFTSPTTASDPVSILLNLNNIDAEEPSEYFTILGEDGTVLGQTVHTTTQCGSATMTVAIDADDFNQWATDGSVDLVFQPNVSGTMPGNAAINDICPFGGGGTTIDGTLSYTANNPSGLQFSYNVNGGAFVNASPNAIGSLSFAVGNNTVVYRATDCAGNSTDCSFVVSVADTEAPELICPGNQLVSITGADDCINGSDLTLPLPTLVDDNCGFNSQTQVAAPQNLSFTYDPNYLEYIAEDMTLTFNGVNSDATGSDVELTVTVIGDVEDSEEFYTIIGENGLFLGTTEVGQSNVTITPGTCGSALPQVNATFTISSATFNNWASDGVITLSALSNDNFTAFPPGINGDGINPICTTFSNGTPNGTIDGNSTISASLSYQTTTVFYSASGATNISSTPFNMAAAAPNYQFGVGTTDVTYRVQDLSGNVSTCTFQIEVADTEAPAVVCQPTTFFVNASGIVATDLDPAILDAGSSDNCGITNMYTIPSAFDCSFAGTDQTVTLVVEDAYGNSSSCSTIVRVESEQPSPSYSVGLCGNDTLYLFANPPVAPAGVTYTYLWSGPNGFSSTLENPILPNANSDEAGSYTVEITGLTFCTSFDVVEVDISDPPNTPNLSVSDNIVCTNETLTLTTQSYSGGTVSYNWYAGIFPGGTYMATTNVPTFPIPGPHAAGDNTYFVIIDIDGCTSDPSLFQTVTFTDAPVAVVNDASLDVCSGEVINLGTTTTGAGFTYQWTGPNGYSSTSQNPAAITNATASDNGTYTLIVFADGCPSDPVNTEVNVTTSPATPAIFTSGTACEGDNIQLTTNISGADEYTWIAPDFSTQTTTDPVLTLNNVQTTINGNWTVVISQNGCDSDASAPIQVTVESELSVQATTSGAACDGEDVQLFANFIPGATYTWSGPNGFASFEQNPIVSANSGTYSVTVSTASGCTNEANTDVVISTAPQVLMVTNDGQPCANGSTDVTLSAQIAPIAGNLTYAWVGPNGFFSVDENPILPNGDMTDNGSYTLIVTNEDGCESNAMTTVVNVSDAPVTPILTAPTTICEGESLILTTTGYTGSNVLYTWTTPVGTFTSTVPTLNIGTASTPLDGVYTVSVQVDGCDSNVSAAADVQVTDLPTAPIIVANNTVCEGETIQLETDLIPGATYLWTGPAGFTASVHNPVIFDASDTNEGSYQVQVIIDGCASAFSVPVNVAVSEAPEIPIALNGGGVCIDDANASMVLSVSPASAMPGAVYTWYNAADNSIVAGPTSVLNSTITNFAGFTDGTYEFYVIASIGGCESTASIPTSVTISTIPNVNAFAGLDVEVCDGQSVSLSAEAPSVGIGTWTQTSGPTVSIANPNSPTTPVSGLEEGIVYTFEWTLSNGACGAYSVDEVSLTVNGSTEVAEAGLNINLCNQSTGALNADSPIAGNTGAWTQSPAQAALGVTIDEPGNPNSTISGMVPGNTYVFTWTISNPGCGIFSTDEVELTIEQTDVTAFAGVDFDECGSGSTFVNAEEPATGIGTWTSPDLDVVFVNPNDPNTAVTGFDQGGDYTLIWTVDNGTCGSSSDTVVVSYAVAPTAATDLASIEFGEIATLDVLNNDVTTTNYSVTIESMPQNGTLEQNIDGTYEYTPNASFAGTDQFTYEICSDVCPDACSQATVEVSVGADAPCTVPTIITPNADGVNDAFVIPCIATGNFTRNRISIFNQWGDEIHRSAPYNNDWQGTFDGQDVPAGTYYYVIDFGDGSKPTTGFLIIER